MTGLIEKRHPADGGWAFFTELPNATGGNVRGRADAFAFGIWPSRGFEAHCYECKESRQDLQAELKDVKKADYIGQYADYFWLVVRDVKIMETLVIPPTWGVLTPKANGTNEILHVVKKAPKRKAKPWSRAFCASIIRHINDKHVPLIKHNSLREDLYKEIERQVKRQNTTNTDHIQRMHDQLVHQVDEFRQLSGVDIRNNWKLGDVSAAVRMIMKAQDDEKFAATFLQIAAQHENLAKTAREAAAVLTAKREQPDPVKVEAPSDEVPSTGASPVPQI